MMYRHRMNPAFNAMLTLGYVGFFGSIWLSGATFGSITSEWWPILPASVLFLILGRYVFPHVRKSGVMAAAYFVVQIALVSWIFAIAGSGILILVFMPLIAQAVDLSRIWMIAVGTAVVASTTFAVAIDDAARGAAARTGLLAAVIVSFVVVYTTMARREREAREQIAEAATLRERTRLAQELHDSLGHYLTVVSVQLEAVKAMMPIDVHRSRDAVQRAQDVARDALNAVRFSVRSLSPFPLELANVVARSQSSGTQVSLAVEGAERAIPPGVTGALLRSAQEALTNVHRHAAASRVSLRVKYEPATVKMTVEDDGVGSDVVQDGLGLRGIRERMGELGGSMRVSTRAGGGFRLELDVPS